MQNGQLLKENSDTTTQVFLRTGVNAFCGEVRDLFSQDNCHLAAGRTLLIESDPCDVIYCVHSGWLTLSKALEDGQKQIIDFALPGDIVDPSAADGTTSLVTIEALTDAVVTTVPSKIWKNMSTDLPALQKAAQAAEVASKARHTERMLRLGKGTAEMRVAYALIELWIRIDPSCKDAIPEFHVPLTQQQLGDFCGLSSVHVCRTMRRLSRNGIIEMRDHMDIRVVDIEALAHLAGVDRDTLRCEIRPG